MRVRLALVVLMLTVAAFLAGCSERHKIDIQSDVCWDAIVNRDQHLNDCGNVTYRITGKLDCIVIQKQTGIGYLRVRIDGRPWTETTEPFGLLQVCN